ncbi:MAG: glycerol kinase GlpK [Flavobacteriaceae bacterium]|nr:glycerol kinase GlpK [Flavobacteriaceae bacterium]
MAEQYILAIDQGTTSSRSILFDRSGGICSSAQIAFEQIYPRPGWVEHDPREIWNSQLQTMKGALQKLNIITSQIAAIGITNQRETVVVWDRQTGEAVYNAIVWQDRRTAGYCDELVAKGYADLIKEKTGLVVDAYFSASKVRWILDNVEGVREKAELGQLCFGTIDSWLVYNLSGGKSHLTDVSNASRTMIFNIHTLQWDPELLDLFGIPEKMLPEICENSAVLSHTDPEIFGDIVPIAGIAGDQQAALFGQMCIEPGMAKNTYGTGCFLLMNTGDIPVRSKNNLLTTVAWSINGKTHYALEGSVFIGGAAVQWVRDGLELVDDAKEIETLALSVEDNGGVVFVPALTGLGAPYWDPYARGSIFGLTRGSNAGHMARATLEGIACQVFDIVKAMEQDSGQACTELRVDGGAAANDLLMQIQSNLFEFSVVRSNIQETTALGAAYLAGLAVGFYTSTEQLKLHWASDRQFNPDEKVREYTQSVLKYWKKAVKRSVGWLDS